MMDDTYDAYGTFDSLNLLTQAIKRSAFLWPHGSFL